MGKSIKYNINGHGRLPLSGGSTGGAYRKNIQ